MTMDIATLTRTLWPRGNAPAGPQVHALLDGARDVAIAPLIRLSNLPSACLYAGKMSPALQAAAPYLVHLAPESRFFRTLFESGWGQAWGFYVVASPDVSLQALRKHFRSLLRVEDEQGTRLVFRLYDPRVFRTYQPTCTAAESKEIFGPIDSIFVESAAAGDCLRFDAPRSASSVPQRGGGHPMRLRQAQILALEAGARQGFERDVKALVRSKYPGHAAGWSSADWERLVPESIERARAFGLAHRACIRRFVEYVVLFGSGFETRPEHEWMAEILADDSLSAIEKIAWIDDDLRVRAGS